MSTRDACDCSSRDGPDCLAQAIHNLFKRLKDLVSEPTLPYFLPYLLNWVHFWSVWRNIEQPNIIRYFEGSGFMPGSSVAAQNNPIFNISFRELLQKQIHKLCVAIWHNPETGLSRNRLNRSVNIAIFPYMVTRYTRADSFLAPAVFRLIDSPEACFILKHEANCLPCG